MKEINVPFSLFDFFAILIPGLVGTFGIYLFLNPTLTIEAHEAAFSATIFSAIQNEIIWLTGVIAISYVLGHVLQEMSLWLIVAPIESGRLKRIGIAPVLREYQLMKSEQHLDTSVVLSIVREDMPKNMALADVYVATAWMFQSLILAMFLILIAVFRGLGYSQITLAQILLRLTPIAVIIFTFFLLYRRYKRMWYFAVWDAYGAWTQSKEKSES